MSRGKMVSIVFVSILVLPINILQARSLGVLASNDSCLIDDTWYERGETNPTNCLICDPGINQYGWTQRSDVCEVYGFCYDHGTQHPEGCAWCDTAASKTSWTVEAGKCLISDRCYDSAYYHGSGCGGHCDPSQSQTSWTVPGDYCLIHIACWPAGTRNLALCGECVPAVSKSSWTPIPGCYKIVFTALMNPHDGNFGSIEVADKLCAKQAVIAGMPGIWKAFISSPERAVRDLIKTHENGTEILNLFGELLYDNWSDMFSQSGWSGGTQIYAFNYYWIDVIGYKGYAWHGSNPDGTYRPDCACQDWTSNLATDSARYGDLLNALWLSENIISCDSQLAVVCVRVDSNLVTSADDQSMHSTIPETIILSDSYPNPFNSSTRIDYKLPKREHVEITIYNLLGQEIATIVDGTKPAGQYSVIWDGRDYRGRHVASGIYFYGLRAGDMVKSKKMTLIK